MERVQPAGLCQALCATEIPQHHHSWHGIHSFPWLFLAVSAPSHCLAHLLCFLKSRESGKSAGECRGGDAGGTAASQVLLGPEHPFHGTRGAKSCLQLLSHTGLKDKVGEAWRRTACPHPAGAGGQRMSVCLSVSIPPVNGNSQSLPGAVIVPCLQGEGVFPSRFPVLPFDLLSHGPSSRLPQRRNSRLRAGVVSFFQRTCWPGSQWRKAFFSANAALSEKAGPGERLEWGCCKGLMSQGKSGTQPWSLCACSHLSGNMKNPEPATRQWVQDQAWMKTQCKSRTWVLCREMCDAFTQILRGGADLRGHCTLQG